MKFIIKLFIFALLIAFIYSLFLREPSTSSAQRGSFYVDLDKGEFDLNLGSKNKAFLKKFAKKIKSFVYKEATLHNPPGDTLPDQLDDELLNKVKEAVN